MSKGVSRTPWPPSGRGSPGRCGAAGARRMVCAIGWVGAISKHTVLAIIGRP